MSHSCLPCADGLASHPQRSDRTGARDRHCLLSRLEREFGVWSIIPLRTTHAHGTISFGLLAMNNLVAKSTALPCLLLLCGYKSPGYTARHDWMATRCSQYLFASRLVAGTKKESEWTALIIFCLVGFGVVATNLLSTTCACPPVGLRTGMVPTWSGTCTCMDDE